MQLGRSQFAARIMTMACAVAVLAGALQVMITAIRHTAFDHFVWVSRDYVWMIPSANVVLFAGAALPFALAGVLSTRLRWLGAATTVAVTLGSLSLLLLIGGLHPLAALALALGIGLRVRGWVLADPGRLGLLDRAALIVSAGLLVGAGVRAATQRIQLGSRLQELPVAAAGAPNVLVIILDTVRAASMSFLGYHRNTTPQLARVAGEGAVFEHAWSTAPWTLPSHAGMFTGLYPSQLSTDWLTPLDRSSPTLGELLGSRGYRTAGFAANHFYTSYESGLSRGFQEFTDYRRTPKQVLLSSTLLQTNLFWSLLKSSGVAAKLKSLASFDLRLQRMWTSDRWLAEDVVEAFLDWEGSKGGKPFFAFLNFYDAHLPYAPPSPWVTRYASDPTPLDRYDAGIAYIDHSLGTLFDEMRRRGSLDNTLVIVSSDHGEAFGEHGMDGHGHSLYREELHVPLVVRFPGRVPAGTRVAQAVTLRDLAATALDVAGGHDGRAGIPGDSWLGLLGTEEGGSAVISEVAAGINTDPKHPVSRGAMRSLVTDSVHYIRNGDGIEELYRWRDDPREQRNLGPGESAVAAMRDAIRRMLPDAGSAASPRR